MEKGISYPEKAVLTNAKVHHRNQLEVMVDDKASMYAFDRGWLSRLGAIRSHNSDDCFAFIRVVEDFKLPVDSAVLSE